MSECVIRSSLGYAKTRSPRIVGLNSNATLIRRSRSDVGRQPRQLLFSPPQFDYATPERHPTEGQHGLQDLCALNEGLVMEQRENHFLEATRILQNRWFFGLFSSLNALLHGRATAPIHPRQRGSAYALGRRRLRKMPWISTREACTRIGSKAAFEGRSSTS